MRSRREYRLDWGEFDSLCVQLAWKVKDLEFDKIVGVSRGGLPIAGYLSKLFEIENVVGLSMVDKSCWPSKLSNALIVDDVFCTGETFRTIEKKINCINFCFFAALYKQDDCAKTSKYLFVRETSDWIVFPTETILIPREKDE